MNPETRLFLRCAADGKRFQMTTNSEASEGESAPLYRRPQLGRGTEKIGETSQRKTNLQLASGAFSSKVAPFKPSGERTKKAPSRGGRTGSNGQQHPVVIDCEVLQKRRSRCTTPGELRPTLPLASVAPRNPSSGSVAHHPLRGPTQHSLNAHEVPPERDVHPCKEENLRKIDGHRDLWAWATILVRQPLVQPIAGKAGVK